MSKEGSIRTVIGADPIITHCNVGVEFLARFLTLFYYVLLDVGGIYNFSHLF